jgi:predicted ATPase
VPWRGRRLLLNGLKDGFCQAIDVARDQRTKLWELRATVSLAHLWRDQGRGSEARARLAAAYAWFTEGFDAPDLTAARALLTELAGADT